MKITRYIVNGGSVMLREDESYEHGQCLWVRDSDYNKIQSQLTALTSQLESVVAENAVLKAAFDKPDAWLSWHSIPPTFYEPDRGGEYLQVHERAGEKNDDGSDSWPVYRNPETETPATDAFLAEVRASAVDDVCLKISNAIVNCYQDEQIGLDAAATVCGDLAAKLRKERG